MTLEVVAFLNSRVRCAFVSAEIDVKTDWSAIGRAAAPRAFDRYIFLQTARVSSTV
jgi:hypothetical protein